MDASERMYFDRALRGDPSAEERIVAILRPMILGEARRWRVEGQTVADLELVAVASVIAALRGGRYDGARSQPRAWLLGHIRTSLRREWHRARMRPLQPSLYAGLDLLCLDDPTSAARAASLIRSAALTERQTRTVIAITQGITQTEVARERGVSRQAVHRMLLRARCRLGRALGE